MSAGADHVLALASDGYGYSWGYNQHGWLGRSVPSRGTKELEPCRVGNLKAAAYVATGSYHSFAIDRCGKLWAWGLNQYGQCGIADCKCGIIGCKCGVGDVIQTPTPVDALDGYSIKRISAGEHHSAVLTMEGKLFLWGRGDDGRLGLDLPTLPVLGEIVWTKDEPRKPIYLAEPHVIPNQRFTHISCGAHDNRVTAPRLKMKVGSWKLELLPNI